MKKIGIVALVAALGPCALAQFASGTIAVVAIGTDGSTLANTGNVVTLKDYTTGGTLANQIQTNTFISGTATSEGQLNYADDGTHSLWVAGYASVAASSISSSATNRRVQGYDVTGSTMGTATDWATTGSNTLYTGNNIRSAVVVNGTLATAGTSTTSGGARVGTGFVAGTPTATSIYSTATNTREAQIWGNNLFWSSASGTTSIFTSPLSAASQTDILNTKPALGSATGWSPYDFVFVNGGQTLYVADDGTTTNSNTGGVLKFTLNGSGTYDFAYRLQLPTGTGFGSATIGARGIGYQNGTIYVTTATTSDVANQIASIMDGGSQAGSTFTALATAATGERFRGLEIVPEPASFAILAVGIAGFAALRRRKA